MYNLDLAKRKILLCEKMWLYEIGLTVIIVIIIVVAVVTDDEHGDVCKCEDTDQVY